MYKSRLLIQQQAPHFHLHRMLILLLRLQRNVVGAQVFDLNPEQTIYNHFQHWHYPAPANNWQPFYQEHLPSMLHPDAMV